MSDINAIEQLRLQVLDNGFTPIRNRDKRTFMKGWPHAVIDEGEIRRWSRRFSRDTGTGIRVEDGLAVIDVDIDDRKLVDHIFNRMLEIVPELEKADVPLLVRHGKGAKEAIFVRTEEMFSRIHSRAWLRPGTTTDDGAHRIEIFGGASPRQFGSFGPHTIDDAGAVTVGYSWVDRSPADTRKSELPALTKKQFFAIVDAAEQELAAAGWTVVEKSTKGENDVQRVYDLTDEMQFDLNTGDRLSLQQLRELAVADAGTSDLRCSAAWLEGPSASRTDRCKIGLDHAGEVFIHEFNTGVTHSPVGSKPESRVTPEETIAALGEKLISRGLQQRVETGVAIKASDNGRDVVRKLLHLYAHCPSETKAVVPIHPEASLPAMTMKAFQDAMKRFVFEQAVTIGETVKTVRVNPADRWLAAPQLQSVAGIRMRPDRERPVYEEGASVYVNSYEPPARGPGGSPDVGVQFMEQLAPDPVERAWLLQWLAYKYLNPWSRGPAIVFVAHERFGTGRGLFGQLIRRLFGAAYVQEVPYSMVSGKTYQAQYTDWLSDNLIVIVNESSETDAGSTPYTTKHNAYEHLKVMVEPGETEQLITRKGTKSNRERVFASFIIATNHMDALPIPESDRRFAVIRNGQPRDQAYWDALVAWMKVPANVDAFARMLEAVDLTGYSPHAAPISTSAKRDMVEMAKSDLDRGMDAAVAELRDVFTLDQLITAMDAAKRVHSLDYPGAEPVGWMPIARKAAARRFHRVGVRDGVNWQLLIGTKKAAVYAKTAPLAEGWRTRVGLREEVLGNDGSGDSGGKTNISSLDEARSLKHPSVSDLPRVPKTP